MISGNSNVAMVNISGNVRDEVTIYDLKSNIDKQGAVLNKISSVTFTPYNDCIY